MKGTPRVSRCVLSSFLLPESSGQFNANPRVPRGHARIEFTRESLLSYPRGKCKQREAEILCCLPRRSAREITLRVTRAIACELSSRIRRNPRSRVKRQVCVLGDARGHSSPQARGENIHLPASRFVIEIPRSRLERKEAFFHHCHRPNFRSKLVPVGIVESNRSRCFLYNL